MSRSWWQFNFRLKTLSAYIKFVSAYLAYMKNVGNVGIFKYTNVNKC